jgi:hypothetical protein
MRKFISKVVLAAFIICLWLPLQNVFGDDEAKI